MKKIVGSMLITFSIFFLILGIYNSYLLITKPLDNGLGELGVMVLSYGGIVVGILLLFIGITLIKSSSKHKHQSPLKNTGIIINEYKSMEELLAAYNSGQRKFDNWDFEEDGSIRNMDLSGVEFSNCFMFLDFRNANLTNAKFVKCNIKTADFRGANLENGLIKNCSVESTMFKGANVENFRFEENYCYGHTTSPNDFEELFKDSDEE